MQYIVNVSKQACKETMKRFISHVDYGIYFIVAA